MASVNDSYDVLAQRLFEVERQLRWWRLALSVLAILGATEVASRVLIGTAFARTVVPNLLWQHLADEAAASGKPIEHLRAGIVVANRLYLTDEVGRVAVKLSGEAGHPSLVLFDREGRAQAWLSVIDDQAVLGMNDRKDLRTVMVGPNTGLAIYDHDDSDKPLALDLNQPPDREVAMPEASLSMVNGVASLTLRHDKQSLELSAETPEKAGSQRDKP